LTIFASQKDVVSWLNGKPPRTAQIFTLRSALRAFPLLESQLKKRNYWNRPDATTTYLVVFRALYMAWYASKGGSRSIIDSDAFYTAVEADFPDSHAAIAAFYAARAASFVENTSKFHSAIATLSLAVDASFRADPAVYGASNSSYAADADAFDRGVKPSKIAELPLWSDGIPPTIELAWKRVTAQLLKKRETWEVWTEWYDDRLAGIQVNQEFDIARLNIPEHIWKRGPKIVNARIAALRTANFPAPNFRDRNELEKWFNRIPPDIAGVIAARAVLRVIPILSLAFRGGKIDQPGRDSLLSVFYNVSVAWAYSRFANEKSKFIPNYRKIVVTSPSDVVTSIEHAASAAFFSIASSTENPNYYASSAVAESAKVAEFASKGDVLFRDNVLYDFGMFEREKANSAQLATRPLWYGGEPTWIYDRWADLRRALGATQENWNVWINWYDSRMIGIAGDKILELARTSIDSAILAQGPHIVNAHIKELIEERKIFETAVDDVEAPLEPIPAQGVGPRFRANENGILERVRASDIDQEGNDISTINQLKPMVLRCASDLSQRLSRNQFPELLDATRAYVSAIDLESPNRTDWGVVWGLGVIMQNASVAAQRQVDARVLPPLEDPAKTALDSLLAMHGPMILATRDGAKLSALAAAFTMTRDQQAELREASQKIAENLKSRRDIITPEAAIDVVGAAAAIGEGPHPERGSVYGLATVKNASIVLLGGAAIATPALLGSLFGQALVGAVVGAPLSFVALEAVKKNPSFAALVTQLGGKLDHLPDIEIGRWLQMRARLLAPFRSFVINNKEPLRKIANSTPELKWMLNYIDFLDQDTRPVDQERGNDKG
jgi:hypothetical protein